MQTATDNMTIDDKIITAINALGQLGIGALVIVCVIFAIAAWVIYLRVGSKSRESEGKRDEENTKIMLQFAGMVERADANREKAVDNRNHETARAIEGITEVLRAATETQRVSNIMLERASASNEQGAKYRKELLDKTTELKMATLDQTDQLKAMQIDFREWPSATKTALELLISSVDELKREIGNPQKIHDQLTGIQHTVETILRLVENRRAPDDRLPFELKREAVSKLPQPNDEQPNDKQE